MANLLPVQKALVWTLEWLCGVLDHIPAYEQGRWFRVSGYGYRIGLGKWSDRLDQRWHTGHWKEA